MLWDRILYKVTGICSHPTTMRDHEIKDVNGVKCTIRGLRCNQCFKFFAFKESLTQSSGAIQRIEQRLEDEQELERLIKLAEQYRHDEVIVRGATQPVNMGI